MNTLEIPKEVKVKKTCLQSQPRTCFDDNIELCRYCGKEFNDIVYHQNKFHRGDESFKCAECSLE